MIRRLIIRVSVGVGAAALLTLSALHAASPCEWDHIDRIVAVGDVHGAYDRYVEILKTAGIVDAGGRWIWSGASSARRRPRAGARIFCSAITKRRGCLATSD